MWKVFLFSSVILSAAVIPAFSKSRVYCRYESNGRIYYGEVRKDRIHQLDGAPWEGGQKTGTTVSMDAVQPLYPSEPKLILGIGKAYKSGWGDQTPFKTVRWFLKPPSAAASSGDDVVLPASLDEVKVETEMVIIIGKKIKNADETEAEKAIFGYTVGNDIVGFTDSYHRLQEEPLDQAEKLLGPGLKICDGFAPFGPFIHSGVDWQNRKWTLRITNSATSKDVVHEDNTSNLAYTPAKMVSDLSRVLTLSPGDVIFSGTSKAIVAQIGDEVEVWIDGLGTLTNRITKE